MSLLQPENTEATPWLGRVLSSFSPNKCPSFSIQVGSDPLGRKMRMWGCSSISGYESESAGREVLLNKSSESRCGGWDKSTRSPEEVGVFQF